MDVFAAVGFWEAILAHCYLQHSQKLGFSYISRTVALFLVNCKCP